MDNISNLEKTKIAYELYLKFLKENVVNQSKVTKSHKK